MAIISSKQSAADDGAEPKPSRRSPSGESVTSAPLPPTEQPEQPEQPAGKSSLLQAEAKPAELSRNEEGLRPSAIGDYIGQKALKEVLLIAIQAAKSRQEPLDHLLLYGPPGLEKPPWP